MSDRDKEDFRAPLRPGSLGVKSVDKGLFPFDAWEFEKSRHGKVYDKQTLRLKDGTVLQATIEGPAFIGIDSAVDLTALDVVALDAAGDLVKGDKTAWATSQVIGFAATAISAGSKVRVISGGKLGGFSGLDTNEPLYLDEAGAYVQTLAGFSSGEYLVKLGVALSATYVQISIEQPVPWEKYDVPTYAELQGGYTDGGGTMTPSVPTILKCEAVGLNCIVIHWDIQHALTNLDHYEIQVSIDDTNWYSLESDGSDWKDTINEDTDCEHNFAIHENIPPGGTEDNPTALTLYYKVRRCIKVGDPSAYCASSSATVNLIESKYIKQDAVTSAKLIANAVIAAKIATNAVEEDKIKAAAVVAGKIAANAVTADKILALNVTTAKLAAGSVETAKIAALAVEAGNIAAEAVTAAKISVTTINTLLLKATTLLVGHGGTGTWDDPDAGDRHIYVDDDEFKIERYSGAAWVDRIHLTYQVMRAKDENAVVIHDIPDVAVVANMLYGGHVMWKEAPAAISTITLQYAGDVSTAKNVTSATTNVNLTASLPASLSNAKGFIGFLQVYSTIQANKVLTPNTNKGGWAKFSMVYNTAPTAYSYLDRFNQVAVVAGVGMSSIHTAPCFFPIVYDGATPYATWNTTINFAGMSANAGSFLITHTLFIMGFTV